MLTELYLAAPSFWIGAAFVLGLCLGSFINVVVYRLPEMMQREWLTEALGFLRERDIQVDAPPPAQDTFNLAVPDSRCPRCGHKIRAWENIPVISWLVLRGKCSACKTSIAPRYPAVELLTGLMSAFVIYTLGLSTSSLLILLATWLLVAMSFIDIDHQLLPDNMTLPLLWLGLIANSVGVYVPLADAVWGAAAGYLVLWLVYWGFKIITGKEGMGYGDFKLLAALGAWMGWQALPVIILLSAVSGIVISVGQMIFGDRERTQPIPFGPYLAVAGWIALLWRDDIVRAYFSFSGL